MNPCKCGGEVHLDYKQGDYTGKHWYAICYECGTEYPLKSDNRIDAEREWNNRKEGKTMKYLYSLLAIVVTLSATAYCHTGNPTASGVMPQVGHCACDKINGEWVKFGTRITTEDGRVLTVTDRFGDGRSNCLDIFMQSENECWQFGRQFLRCRIEVE